MKLFKVQVIVSTPDPQKLIYLAMHQDYSENFVFERIDETPPENKCGEIIVKRLLKGGKGHWGPLEHPQITFNCGYFPHSVVQQARTHRISTSFDVQSFRYTSQHFLKVFKNEKDIEEIFYLRPVGNYRGRQGKNYYYSPEQRERDLGWCFEASRQYCQDLDDGLSEEHARGKLPFDYRQHFVVSFNLRSLLHFLDLRFKKDAQLEIQILCEKMLLHLSEWSPEVAKWYIENRLGKAKLAP